MTQGMTFRATRWVYTCRAADLLLAIALFILFIVAIDRWAKQDPLPFCDADQCAETADALRVMQMEGRAF